ncbi:MAG: hypothetical protein OXT09_20845 [Myxococcales bacterium]|nr:hypothetical protein [Myxococcales bacterium]
MRSRIKRWLAAERAPIAVVVIALCLTAPAITTGLTADDYYQKLVLTGPSTIDAIPSEPGQLFVWADGDPERAHGMMEVGMTAWWTDPTLVMAYFRPIAALTHQLDYALWPDSPALMHAQSLLWFALALLGLSAVYRRWVGRAHHAWLPGLCLLLYAIDDAHGMTIAWIANRNALVALAFALPVLLLHDRHAREGARWAALLGPPWLLLALLAGESALAITTYLFAYALFLDPAGRMAGLRRIAPHAAFAIGWALYYKAGGYGARGSGLVIDPGSEPLRYLLKLAERAPVLLAGQVGFPPSDPWEAYPALAPWLPAAMYGWAVVTLFLFVLAFWPQLRSDPAARAFGLGGLLCTLPVCAQFPHDRLLVFIGVGATPLMAGLIAQVIAREPAERPPLGARGQRIVAWGALVLHLGIAPLWLPLRVRAPLDAERMVQTADHSIDDSPDVRERTVVLINPPVDAYAGYIPPTREAQGRPRPRALRWLATGASDVTITRVDARTLTVRPQAGFLALPSELMQRNPARPIPLGHRVTFTDMSIEVKALTKDGRPAEAIVRFAAPLEDPRYELLRWGERRFEPMAPLGIGQSRTFPRVDFADLLP